MAYLLDNPYFVVNDRMGVTTSLDPADSEERVAIVRQFYDLLDRKIRSFHWYYFICTGFYYLLTLLIFVLGLIISILAYLAQYGKIEISTVSLINGILGIIITFLEGVMAYSSVDSKRNSLLWRKDYLLKLREKLGFQLLHLKPKRQLLMEIEKYLGKLESFSEQSLFSVLVNRQPHMAQAQGQIVQGQIVQGQIVRVDNRITDLQSQITEWLLWRKQTSMTSFVIYSIAFYLLTIIIYLCGLTIAVLGFLVAADRVGGNQEMFNLVIGLVSLGANAATSMVNWMELDVKRQNFLLQKTYCQSLLSRVELDSHYQLTLAQYQKRILDYYAKLSKMTKYRPLSMLLRNSNRRVFY